MEEQRKGKDYLRPELLFIVVLEILVHYNKANKRNKNHKMGESIIFIHVWYDHIYTKC